MAISNKLGPMGGMEFEMSVSRFFDGPYPMDYALCAPKTVPNTPMSLYGGYIQAGAIHLLHGSNEKVLEMWEKQVRKGYIKKVQDSVINGPAIEILSQVQHTVFITIPVGINQTLGIRLPNLVLVVKNLRKVFQFDVQVLDDKNVRRRFRFCNRQNTARVRPALSHVPINLHEGWNLLQVDLQEVVFKTFGTNYKETTRIQIYGNCRIKRVTFVDSFPDEPERNEESLVPTEVKATVEKSVLQKLGNS